MGPFLLGRWEGVAPVAGTFLVFLRNFSKGLRNVAESERESASQTMTPLCSGVCVCVMGHFKYTQKTVINGLLLVLIEKTHTRAR